jgi:hypothetical protein
VGDKREALGSFLNIMQQEAQNGPKRRDTVYIPPSRIIRVSTERQAPGIGRIEVQGHTVEFSSDTVLWTVPRFHLSASSLGRIADSPLFGPLQEYATSLAGDEIEVDTTYAPDMGIVPVGNWDEWKSGVSGRTYREKIYPKALEAVTGNLDLRGTDRAVCVDLFGGDGEFSELLAGSLRMTNKAAEIHIIDANIPSLERAHARFQNESSGKFVVHPPVDLTRVEDVFPEIPNPPNLVTALGGLCDGIVKKNDAIRIAKKVFDGLAEYGLFIVTGYSPVLLNKAGFESVGFKVKQMSIPSNALTGELPYQMYVLIKQH